MKVLVTGHKGYIGSVLTEMLLARGYQVIGYDTDYYGDCDLYPREVSVREIKKDLRDVTAEDLDGIDAVIHLAALSNDPLGELDPRLTHEINLEATLKLARAAKVSGVKRFVYSSSQSMYGISKVDHELTEDEGEKNPITAYARTKWEAEEESKKLGSERFTVVCLRPSTVFGASPSLRCDIVFNNFVAAAFTTGKIEVKSDGTPWRPAVHVQDVSGAFIAALEAPAEVVSGESFNVGVSDGNYTVRELAEAAKSAVPGSKLTFTGEHGVDSRTYRVSFEKILTVLKHSYKPEWTLARGAEELISLFRKVGFTEEQFRGRTCNRLKQISHLRELGKLDENLRWTA